MKTKPTITLSLICLLSCLSTLANSGDEYKKGYVIVNKDTLSGSIKIMMDDNNVLIQEGMENHFMTAKQIDRIVLNNSIYVGYEVGGTSYLFEAIYVDGKKSVFFKENFKFHTLDEAFLPPYFIITAEGILPVSKNKELLDVFEGDKKWMAQYIKNENLDWESKPDIMSIFEYYKENKF